MLVYSDVRWTSKVNVLCDGHQLPFFDESFDVVIAQGVLEHVLDPFRLANEITRVLKQRGLVYSEFPFLQPVHGGAFDFMRLSSTGQRRLWRHFEEINAGSCAHMLKSFMRSLLPWSFWRRISDFIADWTLWWLKYIDVWVAETPAGLDCASGYFFLGRKSSTVLDDSDIVHFYKGAQNS
jgi:SAM-dependent methyltransferase